MERVHWKGEHIIKQVQDELDPDPEVVPQEPPNNASFVKRNIAV